VSVGIVKAATTPIIDSAINTSAKVNPILPFFAIVKKPYNFMFIIK
jgi:hypothetical protein